MKTKEESKTNLPKHDNKNKHQKHKNEVQDDEESLPSVMTTTSRQRDQKQSGNRIAFWGAVAGSGILLFYLGKFFYELSKPDPIDVTTTMPTPQNQKSEAPTFRKPQ